MILIVMVAAFVLPATAQQEWQSTSVMQTSGSSLSSQVTEVGATAVSEMATTTSAPANGPRRIGGASGRNPGDVSTGSTESPLGDALLPLLLFAAGFAGVVYKRRRKSLKTEN